jgi:hypothetical protein
MQFPVSDHIRNECDCRIRGRDPSSPRGQSFKIRNFLDNRRLAVSRVKCGFKDFPKADISYIKLAQFLDMHNGLKSAKGL